MGQIESNRPLFLPSCKRSCSAEVIHTCINNWGMHAVCVPEKNPAIVCLSAGIISTLYFLLSGFFLPLLGRWADINLGGRFPLPYHCTTPYSTVLLTCMHAFTYAPSAVLIFLSLSHLRRVAPVTHVNEIAGYLTVSEPFLFSLKLISSQTEPQKIIYIFMVRLNNAGWIRRRSPSGKAVADISWSASTAAHTERRRQQHKS